MISLEQILSPVPIGRFLDEHWGRQSLHIRGTAGKLAGLFSLGRFHALLESAHHESTIVTATFDRRGRGRPDPSLHIAPSEATRAYHAGATVCVTWIDTLDAELTELCRATRIALGFPGELHMNAYWSPDGAGFDTHFDARVATTLQLEGTKKWRFTRVPVIAWPASNAHWRQDRPHYGAGDHDEWEYAIDAAATADWDEVVLEPGDVLCLPAGALHQAEAVGHSLALNLHFGALDTAAYLGRLLGTVLADRPEWRHVPPLLAHGGLHGGIAPEAAAFLVARLDEAIAHLSAWRRAPESLIVRAIADLVHGTTPPPAPLGPSPALAPSPSLAVVGRGEGDELVCVLGADRIVAAGDTGRVLRAALEAGRFRASELSVVGLAEAAVRQHVEGLVELGALASAAAPDVGASLSAEERHELYRLRQQVRELRLREAASR